MSNKKLIAHEHVWNWYEENKELFSPPVCNKLMHRDQLTVMFVGGPNTRTDFHIDQSSEFFYMLKGNMELPIIECGKRRVIAIKEGQVFLLPSRIPHSPQRPEEGSLGLVIERRRLEGEVDGLRWYTDFDKADQVLWEKYFQCFDLGRDLVPVLKEYHASEEKKSNKPSEKSVVRNPPFVVDGSTKVPDPFSLQEWLDKHQSQLEKGEILNLFQGHPDKEFSVRIAGGGKKGESEKFEFETWLYQLKGSIKVKVDDGDWEEIQEGACAIVPANTPYVVERAKHSIGMIVTQDPCGNNPENRARIDAQK